MTSIEVAHRDAGSQAGPGGVRSSDLPQRLRHETADLHAEVERVVGLPASVSTRADYVTLLTRLLAFHTHAERRWARSRWAPAWAALDVRLEDHERSALLRADLDALGAVPVPDRSRRTGPGAGQPDDASDGGSGDAFGAVLGSLYVVEGSSLGGRVLAPAVRERLGDVPTAFFDGDGRHPRPWRSVQAALRRYDGDPEHVLAGARAAFVAFADEVGDSRVTVGTGSPTRAVAPAAPTAAAPTTGVRAVRGPA